MSERTLRSLASMLAIPILIGVLSVWIAVDTFTREHQVSTGVVQNLSCEVRRDRGGEYSWIIVNAGSPDSFEFRYLRSCESVTTSAYLGLDYERRGRRPIFGSGHLTEGVVVGVHDLLNVEAQKVRTAATFLFVGLLSSILLGGALVLNWVRREKVLPNKQINQGSS